MSARTVTALRQLALFVLCAPYLQGGLGKALDFGAATVEMRHFGLEPAAAVAAAVIALELLASVAVLSGRGRIAGALVLAVFTLTATVIAEPFWTLSGAARFGATNAFFEHVALAGGLALLAWHERWGRPS